MGLWQVVAPDKERVILCEGYIRHELKHGSQVRAEHLVNMYPQYFIKIFEPETNIIVQQTIVEPVVEPVVEKSKKLKK